MKDPFEPEMTTLVAAMIQIAAAAGVTTMCMTLTGKDGQHISVSWPDGRDLDRKKFTFSSNVVVRYPVDAPSSNNCEEK